MKQTHFSLATLLLVQYPPAVVAEPTANPHVLVLGLNDQPADTIAALGDKYDPK